MNLKPFMNSFSQSSRNQNVFLSRAGGLEFKNQETSISTFRLIKEFNETSKILKAATKGLKEPPLDTDLETKCVFLKLSKQFVDLNKNLSDLWDQGLLGKIRYIFVSIVIFIQKSKDSAYREFTSQVMKNVPTFNIYTTICFSLFKRFDEDQSTTRSKIIDKYLFKFSPAATDSKLLQYMKEELQNTENGYPKRWDALANAYKKRIDEILVQGNKSILNAQGEIDAEVKPLFDHYYQIGEAKALYLSQEFPKQYDKYVEKCKAENTQPMTRLKYIEELHKQDNGDAALLFEGLHLPRAYCLLRKIQTGAVNENLPQLSNQYKNPEKAPIVELFYQPGHLLNSYREAFNKHCDMMHRMMAPRELLKLDHLAAGNLYIATCKDTSKVEYDNQ